jgi:uncharacterized protein (DUF736 family)
MSDRRPASLKRRLALTPQQPVTTFFPWPLARPFLAQDKKVAPWTALYCVSAPSGCGSTASGLSPAIEAAMGAARETEKDTTMATIGTFTSTGNGFTGTVRTLALNAKAKLVRVENPSDKGPHFRIFAGNVELGAAWQKTARDTERDYLSVKLDDPSFPAPIYATLIEVEGQEGLQLIWSRPSRD